MKDMLLLMTVSKDDMDNWLTKIVDVVNNLHIDIDIINEYSWL